MISKECRALGLAGLFELYRTCGFRESGLGFRVQGSGFKVQGSGFRV